MHPAPALKKFRSYFFTKSLKTMYVMFLSLSKCLKGNFLSPVKSFNNNVLSPVKSFCHLSKYKKMSRYSWSFSAGSCSAAWPIGLWSDNCVTEDMKLMQDTPNIHNIWLYTMCITNPEVPHFHFHIKDKSRFPPNFPPPVCQRFPYPDLPLHLRSPSLASKMQVLWHLKICWYYQHQGVGIINASQWIWMNVFIEQL